jgi:hypothetical protein
MSIGFLIIGAVVVFMLGTFMSARISPREKLQGELRDKARKIGLQPRLIPAPLWIHHKNYQGKPGGMVAYYSVVLPEATHALVQALVVDGALQVVKGEDSLQGYVLAGNLKGIIAIEIQSNSAAFFWEEEEDVYGEQLETMKSALIAAAERVTIH